MLGCGRSGAQQRIGGGRGDRLQLLARRGGRSGPLALDGDDLCGRVRQTDAFNDADHPLERGDEARCEVSHHRV